MRDWKSALKFALFLLIIALAVYTFRFSPVADNFSYERIRLFVQGFGLAGFLVFVLVYALGAALSVPGVVLTFVGALLYGKWLGTFLNLVGATLGASIAYFVAKVLGRDFVKGIMGSRLGEFERKVEKNGFGVMLLLRLVPIFPFIGVNYAAGLTSIRFIDYFIATFVGMIPGAFVYTYLFATLGEAVLSEGFSWSALLSGDVLAALGLFVALVVVSSIVRKRFNNN
ncbi:TVP38/TMEM64 family protein [Candidatus Woesearchaeota archaeon]|nr:MAG: TVP38/TMEM64 family protein [Candidatus Woesearchaeota archaeon]